MMVHYSEMEKRLWDMGDELRANLKLKSSESFFPVLGLTLLRYQDQGKDRSRRFKIQDLPLFTQLAHCDRLEAQLNTTQTESRCLLEAVLREAFSRKLQVAK